MKAISYLVGDATKPNGAGNKIIAHICNDTGAWGKGFVLALSARSSAPERFFREWYRTRQNNDFGLGRVQFVPIAADILVANMIGQHNIKPYNGVPPIRYEAVETALAEVCRKVLELSASVHLPRIGCGLAGGKWSRIEPIILKQLSAKDVPVFVYDLG